MFIWRVRLCITKPRKRSTRGIVSALKHCHTLHFVFAAFRPPDRQSDRPSVRAIDRPTVRLSVRSFKSVRPSVRTSDRSSVVRPHVRTPDHPQCSINSIQDKGLFFGKMKTLRPDWDGNRLEKEWAYFLTTTKDEDKSYGGPSESLVQLPIPPWMVGAESIIKEFDVFETKQLQSESKASTLSGAEPLRVIVGRLWLELELVSLMSEQYLILKFDPTTLGLMNFKLAQSWAYACRAWEIVDILMSSLIHLGLVSVNLSYRLT